MTLTLELVRGPTEVIHPRTGEAVNLLAERTPGLAELRWVLSELRHQIDDANRVVDAELARRLDMDNQRETVVDGIGLKVNAPLAVTWDVDKLRLTLDNLVNDGRIGAGVRQHLFERRPPKVRLREVSKLLTHPDLAVREEIEACRSLEPQRRRVDVTPPVRVRS